MKDELIFFSRFYPSHFKHKADHQKCIRELRKMGHDQIMNRIKLLEDGSYIPNDLLRLFIYKEMIYTNIFNYFTFIVLSITLKESSNYISIHFFTNK